MSDILNVSEVRSGTWGQLWLDNEQVAEAYGCQIKVNKTKEDVARCRTLINGKKMTAVSITGTVRIYNATSRLIKLEGAALKQGAIFAIPSSAIWMTPTTPTTSALRLRASPLTI